MATAARRGILAASTAAALLVVGAGVALGVGTGLEFVPDAPARAVAERDLVMAWCSRVLLVLAAAWLVIGMLSARTRLVRRPGAAAARASWIASTRPWRARESTLGTLPLDRWLMIIVPGALLVATRAVQTSLGEWAHLAVVLAAWLVFAAIVRLVVGRRSPWPVIAAAGGVVMLRCTLTLVTLVSSGPGGSTRMFAGDPALRFAFVTVAVALFVWLFVAAGWALSTQLGARRATGGVLAGVGAGLAIPASVIAAVGVADAAWWIEPGLVPANLARALADAGVDLASAVWGAIWAGAALALIGALLALPSRSATGPGARGARVGRAS
jgi:hypothetical protein